MSHGSFVHFVLCLLLTQPMFACLGDASSSHQDTVSSTDLPIQLRPCEQEPGSIDELVLDGNFWLKTPEELATIQPFHRITGNLTIETEGINILVLPNLCAVEGSISIQKNNTLIIALLGELRQVGGEFRVYDNPMLGNLGLESLALVEQDLTVLGNEVLGPLSFKSLGLVGGDLWIGSNDNVSGLAMHSLQAVNGTFRVSGNDELKQLELPQLEKIGVAFSITRNNKLNSIILGGLTSPPTNITVDQNKSIGSLDLNSLTSVENINITRNEILHTIQATNLQAAVSIQISDNQDLIAMDLSKLQSVTDQITIRNNDFLKEYDFGSLTTVGGINMNGPAPEILNLDALVSAEQELSFYHLTGLDVLSLPNLERAGSLTVYNAFDIIEFEAPKLHTLNDLRIEDNRLMVRFNIPLLEKIEGTQLRIRDNNVLSDFDLSSLQSFAGNWLNISKNPYLPSCKADALIKTLEANGFEGDVDKQGNKHQPNCD
jgi:hypothetical protein